MSELLTNYETTIVLRPDMADAEATNLVTRIENNIAQRGGNILTSDFWGKHRLAYRIEKQDFGYYATIVFAHPGNTIADFERELKLMPELLRHLIISLDKENIRPDQIKRVDPFKDRDYHARGRAPQAEVETKAPVAAPKSDKDEETRLKELDEKLGDLLSDETK